MPLETTQTHEPMRPTWRAADERVTPRELATAIAAVEQRRANTFRQRSDTLTLGEAVEQLSLDVAPEELLAEVVQQRRRAAVARRSPWNLRRLMRHLLAPAAICGLSLVWWAAGTYLPYNHSASALAATKVATAPDPQAITPERIPVTLETQGQPVMTTLAEIPEGQAAMVSGAALPRLLSVDPAVTEALDASTSWMLLRYGNRAYLRGYLDTSATRRAALIGPFALRNTPQQISLNGKPLSTPVTIPLDTFRVVGVRTPSFGDYQELTLDTTPGKSVGVDKPSFGK